MDIPLCNLINFNNMETIQNGILLLEDEVLEDSLLEMIKGGSMIQKEDCSCGTGNTNKGGGECTCGGGNSNSSIALQGIDLVFG